MAASDPVPCIKTNKRGQAPGCSTGSFFTMSLLMRIKVSRLWSSSAAVFSESMMWEKQSGTSRIEKCWSSGRSIFLRPKKAARRSFRSIFSRDIMVMNTFSKEACP